jgi:hypothetical protein
MMRTEGKTKKVCDHSHADMHVTSPALFLPCAELRAVQDLKRGLEWTRYQRLTKVVVLTPMIWKGNKKD